MTMHDVRIRLLHVNTPEIKKHDAGALEACAFTEQWFIANPEFVLKTEKADSFGRWLGEITSFTGESLNSLLLEKGHAVPFEG